MRKCMVISVHYLFQNYYYYPFFDILSLLSSLQQVKSHEEHLASWTALMQRRYIAVLIYGYYPGIKRNYFSRPKPKFTIP